MADYSMPTLKDIEGVAPPKTPPSKSGNYAMPVLKDMGIATPPKKLNVDFNNMPFRPFGVDTGRVMNPKFAQFLSGAGQNFATIGRFGKSMMGDYSEDERKQDAVLDAPVLDTGWGIGGNIATGAAVGSLIPVGGLSSMVGGAVSKAGAKALGSTLGKSLLLDAGLAGAIQSQLRPMGEDESRGEEAAKGFGLGAGGAALMKMLAGGAGKIYNTVANRWADPASQRLDDIANQQGITLTMGDFADRPGWRHFENASEGVPFTGRSDIMRNQAGQVQDTLYSLREAVRPPLDVTDIDGSVIKYSDANEMMVGELQRNFRNLNKAKDAKFEAVSDLIAQTPNAKPVTLNETRKQVSELVKSHPDVFNLFKDIDSPLLAKLQGLDDNLSTAGGILDASGTPIKRTAKSSYDEAQWLRKRLGALAEAARKKEKVGGVTAETAGQLKLIYSAVNKDLDAWGTQPGNKAIHDAYKDAQKFYVDNLVPFKRDPVLKKVVNEFADYDSDKATTEFFKQDLAKRAETLMKFQTPEGQKAMQFALVNKIAEKGLDRNEVKIGDYLREAKRMSAPTSKVADPEVSQVLSNIDEVLNAARRAEGFDDAGSNVGRYAAVQAARGIAPWVTSGALTGGAAAAGGLPAAAGTAAALAAAVGISRALNQAGASPAGKRLFMASTKLPGPLNTLAEFGITRAGQPIGDAWLRGGGSDRVLNFIDEDNVDPYSQ